MASRSPANPRFAASLSLHSQTHAFISTAKTLYRMSQGRKGASVKVGRVSNGGDSYLDMWNKAVDRERKEIEFQKLADNLSGIDSDVDKNADDGGGANAADGDNREVLEKKSEEFNRILRIPREERDRVQRMQVIDRAAAAIAAARSLVKNTVSPLGKDSKDETDGTEGVQERGSWTKSIFVRRPEGFADGAPGPDFWSWAPPKADDQDGPPAYGGGSQTARKSAGFPTSANSELEKDRPADYLSIPFESKLKETLPPFQSLLEINTVDETKLSEETPSLEEHDLEVEFSAHAAEAAQALGQTQEKLSHGVNPDGSMWWKETGIEQRPDGVLCRWTMRRGVSADQTVEWQEKYWEASDEFDYKELGSEKSGRDANGNVWREYWRESMLQRGGIAHLEKTADKWGRNGKDEEWQEQWWEHYDATGQSEKWAHKWCSIDPNTPLEAGHAHVWHERWGEKYDGHGGSIKYTDKWAERCEGDGWMKWGDKWDEHFDSNAHGVKQGETWWQGKHGESWNRTWGERHNSSGWVHKYGKSSSGEHWDTHVEQETWYERFPHYGFYHCFDNSAQLRQVKKPSEMP